MLFCELRPRVTNAMADVDAAKTRYASAKTTLTQASNSLAGMVAVYADVNTEVNAGAVANPANPAWLGLKAEKDLALGERSIVKSDVDCVLAAFEKLASHGASAVLEKLNELV